MKTTDFYKKHLIAFILGPALKMIEAFFDLLIPLFMKAIIDLNKYLVPEDIPNKLTSQIGIFIRSMGTWANNQALSDALIGGTFILIMGVVGFLTTMLTQFVAAITCVKVGTDIRNNLYRHILKFSKKERERIGSARLLTALNSDSYQVQQGVLHFIRLIVRAPFIIIGALIFSFILDVKIGFIFLAIVPIILLIIFFVMSRSSKKYTTVQSKVDEISSFTSDTLLGNKVIHAFDKKEEENNKFEQLDYEYKKNAVKALKITSLVNPLTYAVITISTIMVVVFAGFPMFDSPDATSYASTIMAEIAYLGQIFFTLVQLSNIILIFTKSRVSRKRIDDIFDVTPSIIYDENGLVKSINKGDVIYHLDNISIRYEESGNYALSDISLDIRKGESIGFIGGTGSGKSTLISLLNRLNDIDEGQILYKGEDIRKYNLKQLRDEVGVVSQKATLFNGTIKSNLLLGNPYASKEQMVSALKIADAYDFVNGYDDGIDHLVVDEGKNFSGGQRQRLSIARTILKKHEVIILDDSTSALDLLTEKRVRDNIDFAFKDSTKIIISQRVSSLINCDRIYLLNKGKVVAFGNHEELLKTSLIYKEIYDSQMAKEGL